ncbi:hypothetical protein CTR2_R36700 [Comamonas thiooxydans]|uniref:hypothetical protein n=1 Tax=Comamonas thiooxydans TaxID=363952 RepID=UPI0020CED223|nr:hypothetical protein [Comamonas thiooxydans]BDR10332.1 hypothetical protein CTR2_R36700 [Comamonas thiooxydans]
MPSTTPLAISLKELARCAQCRQLPDAAGAAIIGGFSPAESHARHRRHLQDPAKAALCDPRVRSRIERGASMNAADYRLIDCKDRLKP